MNNLIVNLLRMKAPRSRNSLLFLCRQFPIYSFVTLQLTIVTWEAQAAINWKRPTGSRIYMKNPRETIYNLILCCSSASIPSHPILGLNKWEVQFPNSLELETQRGSFPTIIFRNYHQLQRDEEKLVPLPAAYQLTPISISSALLGLIRMDGWMTRSSCQMRRCWLIYYSPIFWSICSSAVCAWPLFWAFCLEEELQSQLRGVPIK